MLSRSASLTLASPRSVSPPLARMAMLNNEALRVSLISAAAPALSVSAAASGERSSDLSMP
jgi:hypothetical protein